jgi:monovalent cation:H+ antiporter-2, CPA2 family
MTPHADLTGLAIVMGAALLLGFALRRLGQSEIVGYILAGIALGPSGFGIVADRAGVSFLAELGVLMLLFLVGLEMSLRAFKGVWRAAVLATGIQFAAAIALIVPIALAMGWGVAAGLVIGVAVAVSSTALTIKLLEKTNLLRQEVGQVAVGVAIAQDLGIIIALILTEALSKATIDAWPFVKAGIALVFLVLLVVYLTRRHRIELPFMRRLEASPDFLALAGLAFCFGGAALGGLAGLSPAFGAFLAGLVLGNTSARAELVRTTHPIQAVLVMLFFLSVGLLIDFAYIAGHVGVLAVMLVVAVMAKTAIAIVSLRVAGQPWTHAFIAGIVLASLGEFSLVLTQAAERGGVLPPALAQLVVATVAGSILVTPLWLAAMRRLLRALVLHQTSLDAALAAIRVLRLRAVLRWRRLRRWRKTHPAGAGDLSHPPPLLPPPPEIPPRAPPGAAPGDTSPGDTSPGDTSPGDASRPEGPR